MRILFFSDVHSHPFKPYATILDNGMNSRLADAVNCIDQIVEYVSKNDDIDLVAFGGDMFHVRKTINVMAFNAVYEAMAKFCVAGVPVVMIHGNHDQADKYGEEHSIHAFRTFCTVVDQPSWQVAQGKSGAQYNILGIPYTENIEHLRDVVKEPCPVDKVTSILLAHLGIQGARVGADFVYTNPHDAAVSDLNLGAFQAAFLGHYHEHQKLADNCWYIGAPLQHNWGDRGQRRGFLTYDTEANTVEQHDLMYPRFVQVTPEDLKDGNNLPLFDDSFVRVIDSRIWSDDEREQWRTGLSARSVEVALAKNGKSTDNGPRLEVGPTMSFQDMLQTYVTSGVYPHDELDSDYLLQLGMEIMEEVEAE